MPRKRSIRRAVDKETAEVVEAAVRAGARLSRPSGKGHFVLHLPSGKRMSLPSSRNGINTAKLLRNRLKFNGLEV